MPELPILGSDGKLAPVAPVLTLAVMNYPTDERARLEFAASYLVGILKNPENLDLSSLGFLVPYLRTAPTPNELEKDVQKAVRNSGVASKTLRILLSAAEHHPHVKMNVEKALYVIEKLVTGAPGERTRDTMWKKFRPVAHLDLAVSSLANAHGVPRDIAQDPAQFDPFGLVSKHFEEFLAYAEAIRCSVEKHRLIKSAELWRVPASLEFPALTVLFPPLTEPMLAVLATYSSKHSKA